MILNLACSKIPLYTFTGPTKTFVGSEYGDWELALTSSGTITFSSAVSKIDVFIVGGGKAGSAGGGNYYQATGGAGGAGGQCRTIKGISVTPATPYTITLGGSGESTTTSWGNATSGGGAAGGSGAYASGGSSYSAATAGSDGYLAFGEADTEYYPGYRYGSGGGGGGVKSSYREVLGKAGGASSGGRGGLIKSEEPSNGVKGVSASGGGGGGGCTYAPNQSIEDRYSGGAGGSGIVIIRNARS